MVFVDLSNSASTREESQYSNKLASPADRFLAFFIDFIVTSPVATLFASGSLREIRENIIDSASSQEIIISVATYLIIFLLVNVIMQVFMLHFWNASLGQKTFNIKIVKFPADSSNHPLSLTQCLTRATGPWISMFALGIPCLEMFSHSYRRTFYDRLSDTLVITNKKTGAGVPNVFEANFVKQWMQIVSFVTGFALLIQFVSYVRQDKNLSLKLAARKSTSCPEVNLFSNHKFSRLDRALALYLVNPEEFSCLEKELDNDRVYEKEAGLAYLAKSILEKDKELIKTYQSKVCETGSKTMECAWLKKSSDFKSTGSMALQVLQVQEHIKSKNWMQALETIEPLLSEELLFPGLQTSYVKAYISWTNSKSNARQPASDKNLKFAESFKKRYGVE